MSYQEIRHTDGSVFRHDWIDEEISRDNGQIVLTGLTHHHEWTIDGQRVDEPTFMAAIRTAINDDHA